MTGRERIRETTAICVLSGVLAIGACGGAQPSTSSDELEQTSAALSSAKPFARGAVRDGAGAPIARARVDVRAAGGYRILACATTAADGSFALDVRAGTYDLTVTPRTGFAPQAFPGETIAKGTELELIILTVGPAQVTVSGHVTDQNGQPLSVAVCGPDCIDTDASGAFTITARTDLPLLISGGLSPAGGFDAKLTLDPTQSTPLDIVIPIFNLDGTLLDATGAPMPSVSLTSPPCSTIVSDQISGTFCVNGTVTDSDGRFHFTALPGDVTLQVFGDTGIYTTVSVAGDTDAIVQVPPAHILGGRITDRDGNGLPGDTLCLVHSGCQSHFCSRSCTQSDANGQYQFTLSEGPYDAELTSPAGSTIPIGFYGLSQTITLTQATELDLTFQNRIVTGTVLNPDGTPAPNIPVSDSCHDIDVNGFTGRACAATVTTDASGRFQMMLPGPGDVVLTAKGSSVASVRITVTGDTHVIIPLAPTPPVTGQVLNADGSPAVGFSVCYTPTGLFGSLACTSTDAGGLYQVVLPPGPYSLSIFGQPSGVGTIEIDEPVTVPSPPSLVRLARTRTVAVRIVNTDGTPLAGAQLFPVCGSALAVSGETERFCADPPAADASGAVTVVTAVGGAMDWQIEPEPGIDLRVVAIDSLSVSDGTELTIALQSPPASP